MFSSRTTRVLIALLSCVASFFAWTEKLASAQDTPAPRAPTSQPSAQEPTSQPSPQTPTSQPSASPAEPPPPPPPGPDEVNVRGRRREIGGTKLSANEIREMPGAFGDPFRAIEAMPGAVPIVSGLPYFYMRGAPPNNSGFYVDGVQVPVLFHLGLGMSVIHPALIDRVDFYPGAPPAYYGGFAGATIAGTTREPAQRLHGEANLRLVDAGALVESPFANDRGTALVSGRFGYPGPILSAFAPDLQLGYWDYQSRVTWKLGDKDTIGIFAFGAHDHLRVRERNSPADIANGQPAEKFVDQLTSDFHRIDLRWDHALANNEGKARVAVTLGHDSRGSDPSYLYDKSAAVRFELEKRLSSDIRLRTGANARLNEYGFDQRQSRGPADQIPPSSADPPPTNLTGGVRADIVWRVAPRVELVPGARFDIYSSSRDRPNNTTTSAAMTTPAIDPRLSARVMLTHGVTYISTFGLAHQYPSLRAANVPAGIISASGFRFDDTTLQRAVQASQGIELLVPTADLTVTTNAFVSSWTGMTDVTAVCQQVEPGVAGPSPPGMRAAPFRCPEDNHGVRGLAYGVELLVRRPITKRLSGWLSYTLSRSRRETRFLTLDESRSAVATVPSEGDRRHVLNVIMSYDLGRRWRFGSRFMFLSGAPYSKLDGSIPIPPYNNQRYDPFFRVDVRLEKRWLVGKSSAIAFVVEGQNVTLSKDTYGTNCDTIANDQGETTTCTPNTFGPVTIPSIGLEAFF